MDSPDVARCTAALSSVLAFAAVEASTSAFPVLTVNGKAFECGEQLGFAWRDALRVHADRRPTDLKPWWMNARKPFRQLIDRHAPHLPDLFRGMAKGAGLRETEVGSVLPAETGGCTSFALQPRMTLDGQPMSGQTKDNHVSQTFYYVVLRLRMTDAPPALTLTYPGWVFGHGFVVGGCSIWRNSLLAAEGRGALPHGAWGLLAQHCHNVDEIVELTRQHGVVHAFHATVADEQSGIAGIAVGGGKVSVLRPTGGLYVHANAVRTRALASVDTATPAERENSLLREERLRARVEPDLKRMSVPLLFAAMSDHVGYPASVCAHTGPDRLTTAAIVAEPKRRLLHACRGNPCSNLPITYAL